MEKEKWIPAYHPTTGEQISYTLISSEGKIWVEPHSVKRKDGHAQKAKSGYFGNCNKNGYLHFNGVRVSRIALASQLKGPIPEGRVVHHKDNNSLNNSFANLELMTQLENMQPERVKRTKPTGRFPADCKEAEPAIDLPGELWKLIDWYENANYAASNLGRIKNVKKNTIKKKSFNWARYEVVSLCHKGKSKTFHVGRVIYQAFHGEIPPKLEINHIDHVKTNNCIENLEAVSSSENKRAAKDHGQFSHTREEYDQLVELIKQGKSDQEISRMTRYGLSHISKTRREDCGVTLRKMSKPSDFEAIKEDAVKGLPIKHTMQRLGMNKRTVVFIRRKHGLGKFSFASEEENDLIKQLLLDRSLSLGDIGLRVGKSRSRICQLNKQWGIR